MLFHERHHYGTSLERQVVALAYSTTVSTFAVMITALAAIRFTSGTVLAIVVLSLVFLAILLGLFLGLTAAEFNDLSTGVGLGVGSMYGAVSGVVLAFGVAMGGWRIFFSIILGIVAIDAFRHYLVVVPRRRTADTTPAPSSRPSSAIG